MNWIKIKLKDLENVFYEIFNPELLYGEQAKIYDEALTNSKHFGTTWKKEMQKINQYVYFDFIVNYLEEEGYTPDEFKEE
jgi:hypothetical protein